MVSPQKQQVSLQTEGIREIREEKMEEPLSPGEGSEPSLLHQDVLYTLQCMWELTLWISMKSPNKG